MLLVELALSLLGQVKSPETLTVNEFDLSKDWFELGIRFERNIFHASQPNQHWIHLFAQIRGQQACLRAQFYIEEVDCLGLHSFEAPRVLIKAS